MVKLACSTSNFKGPYENPVMGRIALAVIAPESMAHSGVLASQLQEKVLPLSLMHDPSKPHWHM
jgi:hypothetical protein